MRKILIVLVPVLMLVMTVPVGAAKNTDTWIVDDDGVECPDADFAHPQDAVNAANPGDTIRVCPGIYGSRVFNTKPPHWGRNDQYAPALIVYKDGLTIEAIDPDPAKTIIQSTHDWWSNGVAVQASTGGVWDGTQYLGAGVYPENGTAPNAVSIIASDVTIRGFTIHKPYMGVAWFGFWNTAGVMIGGLYAGDPYHLGVEGNTVAHCSFSEVWQAVFIWHSSHNRIAHNTVAPLGNTEHWSAILMMDGAIDGAMSYPSQHNSILNNDLADKGIFVGAWLTPEWTDNRGTHVHGNSATEIGTAYSSGKKIFSGNRVLNYWAKEASDHRFPGKSNHAPPPNWGGPTQSTSIALTYAAP